MNISLSLVLIWVAGIRCYPTHWHRSCIFYYMPYPLLLKAGPQSTASIAFPVTSAITEEFLRSLRYRHQIRQT